MKKFDLIFISTCCNHEYIYKLIKSIVECNDSLMVCLIVVNQGGMIIENIDNTVNTRIVIIDHKSLVNSSIARNVGIEYLIRNKLAFSFLCFPDDDSSYDSEFFNAMNNKFLNKDFRNFIIDVYCTGTKIFFRKVNYSNNRLLTKFDYDLVGAVNIVINYETFQKVLYFDTRFGVNAKYGAGEDGDYFIRATEFDDFYYCNELYNFHPSGDSKFNLMSYSQLRLRMINYGIGCVALLTKHKMYKSAFFLTFRAIGGFLSYFLKRKFYISLTYLEAFVVRFFYLIKFLIFPIK